MVAQSGQVVIGERTHELVKGKFEVNDLGTVALKGRKESVRVFEVLSEKVK
jgi:class 3 adenylate cyclase